MNASPAATRIRVLSGRHAGVSIDWLSSRLVVGASEEFDVFIGDWNAQRIELQHDAEGRPQACWSAAGDDVPVDGEQRVGDDVVRRLEPWMPVRFGAIILCIGPATDDWPDDAELLRRCFAPSQPTLPAPAPAPVRAALEPRRRAAPARRIMIAAVACCGVAAAPSAVQHRAPPQVLIGAWSAVSGAAPATPVTPATPSLGTADVAVAASAPPVGDPVARLRRSVPAQALHDLTISSDGQRAVLRGVLPSRAAVDRLNVTLDELTDQPAPSRRFAAAQDILERLHESMPALGLGVRHVDRRRFEVSGRVADPARAGAAVRHVAADLADFGVEVDIALVARHGALPTMSALLIDSQGNSILRTRNGVKHIVPAPTQRARPAATPTTHAPDGAGETTR